MRALQRACKALSKENDKLEVTPTVLICFSCSFASQIGMWGHTMVFVGGMTYQKAVLFWLKA
jgi:hypothetical protein